LKKRNKRPGQKRSEAEAVHVDNLLDEALRETFPASDPIAITIEKPSKAVAHGDLRSSPGNSSMAAITQKAFVSSAPPDVDPYDPNLWAVRQISYFFEWWSLMLGGRK
jgi:hypothetical protein